MAATTPSSHAQVRVNDSAIRHASVLCLTASALMMSGVSHHRVTPLAGRFLTFSSGDENLHQVQRVETGTRLTMSMWFTCDSSREFATFLDGKVHSTFVKPAAREQPSGGSGDEL